MNETLLEVEDLKVHFPVGDEWKRRDKRVVKAVDGVVFLFKVVRY